MRSVVRLIPTLSDEQLLAELRQFASSSKSSDLIFRRESILALFATIEAKNARIRELKVMSDLLTDELRRMQRP